MTRAGRAAIVMRTPFWLALVLGLLLLLALPTGARPTSKYTERDPAQLESLLLYVHAHKNFSQIARTWSGLTTPGCAGAHVTPWWRRIASDTELREGPFLSNCNYDLSYIWTAEASGPVLTTPLIADLQGYTVQAPRVADFFSGRDCHVLRDAVVVPTSGSGFVCAGTVPRRLL